MTKISRRAFNNGTWKSMGAVLAFGPSTFLVAETVDAQPFSAQVRRLLGALDVLGEPLPAGDRARLDRAFTEHSEAAAAAELQAVLDQHVLVNVQISPESRVSATRGAAPAVLVEKGWRTFLVKVQNDANDRFALRIQCPQARPMGRQSAQSIVGVSDFTNGAIDEVEARARWAAIDNWTKPPLTANLSGLEVEYRILQVYSRDRGKREATFEADAGYGEQDLGYRSSIAVLFDCLPCVQVPLKIADGDGTPVFASLTVTDGQGRVYPPLGKRELPDLWFEKQVYRNDGESLSLPVGRYTVEYSRGPEYLVKRQAFTVVEGTTPSPVALQLERWISPAQLRYYSGDVHIHAAGCAHYESPTEGVAPEVMERQVKGERSTWAMC